MLAQIDPWRLRLSPGGSEWTLGADIEIGLLGETAVFSVHDERYSISMIIRGAVPPRIRPPLVEEG